MTGTADTTWTFTTGKTVAAAAATIIAAFIGVLVAAGLHVRPELRDSIVSFVTVTTPFVVVLIGWLHHAHAKVVAATVAANATLGIAAAPHGARRAPGVK